MAKVANDILDRNSKVLYGTMYTNGDCTDFGTSKSYTDTHVCLGVEISVMGSFKPSEQTIALDRPQKEDIERMQAQRIKQLERQIEMQKGK